MCQSDSVRPPEVTESVRNFNEQRVVGEVRWAGTCAPTETVNLNLRG
jgi:hypothetical protein